jgi:hypothetical protein
MICAVEPPPVAESEQRVPAPAVAAPAAEDHAMAELSPRALARQALAGGVAPLVVFELARHAGAADATALAISAAPPALAIVIEWLWRRSLNVIGAIVLVGIVLGLAAAGVLHGDELLLKMRESVVTGIFGLLCLISLVLPVRPAMFHIGRALAGAGGPHARQEFDALWEVPRARRVFRIITVAWGLGFTAEAGLRAVLAFELSTGSFLAVTPVVSWVVIGSLTYWTIAYTRASRRRGEAEAEAAAA